VSRAAFRVKCGCCQPLCCAVFHLKENGAGCPAPFVLNKALPGASAITC